MIAVVSPSRTSTSGRAKVGMKPCTNALYVSLMSRCDSAAMVPNTSELLPEPETPVNTVSRRFGISTLTSLRLLTRAPTTRIRSWRSATSAAGDRLAFGAACFVAALRGALVIVSPSTGSAESAGAGREPRYPRRTANIRCRFTDLPFVDEQCSETKEGSRHGEEQVSCSADRRQDQGARRLAGRDARPAPCVGQGSRSRSRRGVEVERSSDVVPRRNAL